MVATDYESELTRFLLSLADDDFVIGHRLSDWVAQAPTFEEDNTLASMSQDELGHARMWYEVILDHDLPVPEALRPAVEGTTYDLDNLGLNRAPKARRNSILVEPKHVDVQRAELRSESLRGPDGEYKRPPAEAIKFEDLIAISAVYHDAERLLVETIRDGNDLLNGDLSARAEAILNEESFHREHVDLWLDRLTTTDEGQERLTTAFNEHLPNAADLFAFPDEIIDPLVSDGIIDRAPADLQDDWLDQVHERLLGRPIDINEEVLESLGEPPATNGRRGEHTAALDQLVGEIHSAEAGLVGDHPVTRYEV
ncbi:1,2-phenylacetyl-CoA epoxidase subunit PaaC [Halobacterium sp. KA-6]|uniref:1,2-phenylacetyl-CoA epoxidase subunit PaaC n=1 Tax=Halobacterium sp. KA-6 TaxID=2896368 RepID=UPI001E333FDA|nr:Phenylacetic acid catabolic protein [Halobacterium sp. KA-6]MCD2204040.1 phenylacetate-CoA oxygenase subunit PaaI [Halobacterium sp. KA-6]